SSTKARCCGYSVRACPSLVNSPIALTAGIPMAILWIALAFSAGLILAAQAGFNVMLANGSGGPIWGAFLSNLAGIVALGVLIAVLRLPFPRWQALAGMPPSAWLGGVCGVAYVIGIIMISPRIGLAATVALAVAGQTIG